MSDANGRDDGFQRAALETLRSKAAVPAGESSDVFNHASNKAFSHLRHTMTQARSRALLTQFLRICFLRLPVVSRIGRVLSGLLDCIVAGNDLMPVVDISHRDECSSHDGCHRMPGGVMDAELAKLL